MATIVNDRDIYLQSLNPRVAGATMSSGVVIDPSQVTGLGLVLNGTKMVYWNNTGQVFSVPSVGAVSPASITLTVNAINLSTAAASISVVSGTTSTTPVLTSGAIVVFPTDMTTDVVSYKVSIVDTSVTPNVTYSDVFTIYKVHEGATGTLTAVLSNENLTLPADTLGNITNWGTATGTFKVFQGNDDVSDVCSYAILTNVDGLAATINSLSGAYKITGNWPSAKDSTTITFKATFGASTVQQTMTLYRSKATTEGTSWNSSGPPGADGTSGVRGSRTFYVTLSGSTNTYSDTLATTTASVDGGPVRNDVVTESNASVGFSQTKFYDGTAWQTVNAVVDGNLLVPGTVGAGALSANSVSAGDIVTGTFSADNAVTRGLTVRDASGNVLLGVGSAVPASYIAQVTGLNLIDSSAWKTSVAPSSLWPVNEIGDGTTDTFVVGTGPSGQSGVFWKSVAGNGLANAGGWNPGGTNLTTIDKSKAYRFCCPIYIQSGTSSAYWGITPSSVCDLNTTTVQTNPYFAFTNSSSLTTGRWYLFVGYVYPYGSTGNTHNGAGVYDMLTGEQIYSHSNSPTHCFNFNWASTVTTVGTRAYQYYATTGSVQWFAPPLVHIISGAEPTLDSILSSGGLSGRNPVTSANASTFIADAAIGTEQVGTLTASNLTVSALSNTVNGSASSGARVEIASNVIRVYDSSNVLRVKIGNLA